MRKTLVFGATSAIAAATARRLAARGDRMYLVGRNAEKLAALVDDLGRSVAGWTRVDLTDFARHPALVREAVEALGGLDVVIVCHGLLGDQLATEADFTAAHEVIDVNFTSAVSLLIPVANELERRRAGHIAVVTSVAGDRGRPRNFTYGAAKSGLATYLQGLRSRLWRAGVQVHTIKPGPVDTPMTADHPKNLLFATADQVAARIVGAIDRGGAVTYAPWYWWPIMLVVRRLPEPVFQRFPFLAGR